MRGENSYEMTIYFLEKLPLNNAMNRVEEIYIIWESIYDIR